GRRPASARTRLARRRAPRPWARGRNRAGRTPATAAAAARSSGDRPDRRDDRVVAGAPAEVAADRLADLDVGRSRDPLQQVLSGEEHARQAVAALECVLVPEGPLQRGQLAVARQSLEGLDLCALGG